VGEQRGLHLARADPVAAGLDQIDGAPPDDPVVAVLGDDRGVTGAEPAVGGERPGGGVGPAKVAVEQGRGADL